jgi:peptide/nickel transport system ATP-binding protein
VAEQPGAPDERRAEEGSMGGAGDELLRVSHLRVELADGSGVILEDVSTGLLPGRVLGVVGESGSGKTTLALSLFGYSRRGTRITGGSVRLQGREVLGHGGADLTAVRGRLISYVPQDPAAALNPGRRIGDQMQEAVSIADPALKGGARLARAVELLETVHLPVGPEFLRRYPHQLSGGQLQRVVIAMALAGQPPLLVMDEPTTALDVTTQARILALVKDLAARYQLGIMYVTHDLAVVASIADEIAVMYAGTIVEAGTARSVLGHPSHPYTRSLIAAAPEVSQGRVHGIAGRAPEPRHHPAGCLFADRCPWVTAACRATRPALSSYTTAGGSAACIRAGEITAAEGSGAPQDDGPAAAGTPSASPAADAPAGRTGRPAREEYVLSAENVVASYRGHEVLHGISLAVRPGQCLAIVGESGSGKTTLARTIAGLHREASGQLHLSGQPLGRDARGRPAAARLAVQYVFQNPYASLNPRRTVGKSLAQPLRLVTGLSPSAVTAKIRSALDKVQLPLDLLDSYPDELSGGQRQRVAIARALVAQPAVLLCDEVTSALDVSVQASVVELLLSLKAETSLTMLFITHNIALASIMADDILVLHNGSPVEYGPAAQVVQTPRSGYARSLIQDTPSLHTAVGETPGFRP